MSDRQAYMRISKANRRVRGEEERATDEVDNRLFALPLLMSAQLWAMFALLLPTFSPPTRWTPDCGLFLMFGLLLYYCSCLHDYGTIAHPCYTTVPLLMVALLLPMIALLLPMIIVCSISCRKPVSLSDSPAQVDDISRFASGGRLT